MEIRSLSSALGRPALTDLVGNTPLIAVEGFSGMSETVEVHGKAEWFNPGGSVKDRAALAIIEAAEALGTLAPGKTLIDATSGNTGIAYAWIGAARGIDVHLCLPQNASQARKRLLRALGAELTLTSPMDGTDGAIREARRMAEAHPDRFVYLDQYSNPANWQAHYRGTAEEIWSQTEGRVTHVVAGLGTTGTLVGTGRRLRELNPDIEVVAVQPDSPLHVMEGMKHLPSCHVPAIYDATAHQRTVEVSSEAAIEMVQRQARRGLLVGWSAGAALAATEALGRTLERAVIVTILPDGAERYLDDPLWRDGP